MSDFASIIRGAIEERLNQSKIQEACEDAGRYGEQVLRDGSPVRTGFLRDSNGYEVSQNSVRLFNDADYAEHVNNGTSRIAATHFFDRGVEATEERLYNNLKGI